MRMVNIGQLVAFMGLVVAGMVGAGEIEIIQFQDGYLTFTNEDSSRYYRIEFKPHLTDPDGEWEGTYAGLRNIQSADPEITVPVGVFYRVVGHAAPFVGGTATAAHILSGRTAYVGDVEVTGEMPNVGQQVITPGSESQMVSEGYHQGTGFVAGDANLVAENIRSNVSVFGVVGTYGGVPAPGTVAVPRTGQTESYRAGDDGALLKGVAWPSPRFEDNGNGTVTDLMTGLVWVKEPHALTGNAGERAWDTAIDFSSGLNYAGRADWRLPNVRELQSLIHFGKSGLALPDEVFTGIEPASYWTSTTHAGDALNAWGIDITSGVLASLEKTEAAYLWPVRNGDD